MAFLISSSDSFAFTCAVVRGLTKRSTEPETRIRDCGVVSWALVSVILSFSIVSGSLTFTLSAGFEPD